jgi:hypothetical protein
MNPSYGSLHKDRAGERGQGGVKFLFVVAIIGLIGYVGFQYVPVAYQAYGYKDLMQHDVDMAATQGFDPAWVKTQLVKNAPDYGVPADVSVVPTKANGRVAVTVKFARPIPLPGYIYQYEFEHTARSTEFFETK